MSSVLDLLSVFTSDVGFDLRMMLEIDQVLTISKDMMRYNMSEFLHDAGKRDSITLSNLGKWQEKINRLVPFSIMECIQMTLYLST